MLIIKDKMSDMFVKLDNNEIWFTQDKKDAQLFSSKKDAEMFAKQYSLNPYDVVDAEKPFGL